MPSMSVDGQEIELDEKGFLIELADWTPAVAAAIAEDRGISLGERHWQAIDFCRQVYAQEGFSPSLRQVAKESGVPMKELYQLFPHGPGRLVSMIAGLPKPRGCI